MIANVQGLHTLWIGLASVRLLPQKFQASSLVELEEPNPPSLFPFQPPSVTRNLTRNLTKKHHTLAKSHHPIANHSLPTNRNYPRNIKNKNGEAIDEQGLVADLRDIRHGPVADPALPPAPRRLLLLHVRPLPPLLRPHLRLLRGDPPLLRRLGPVRRRLRRVRDGAVGGLPVLRRGELHLLGAAAAPRHGPADRRRGQRLVDGEERARPRVRPGDPAECGGDAAQEDRQLGPGRGVGPVQEDRPLYFKDRKYGRCARVRDVPGRRREEAAVPGQLLRRGGVGGVRAHGGEGARPPDGGGGGGEDAGGGGAGAGAEARRGGRRLGHGPRGGVRAAAAGAKDGGHPGVGAGHGLHDEQSHRVVHQAQRARCGPR